MGQRYPFYSKTFVLGICKLYSLAYISARDRENGHVTKTFSKILTPSYNWDIPIVHWVQQNAKLLPLLIDIVSGPNS